MLNEDLNEPEVVTNSEAPVLEAPVSEEPQREDGTITQTAQAGTVQAGTVSPAPTASEAPDVDEKPAQLSDPAEKPAESLEPAAALEGESSPESKDSPEGQVSSEEAATPEDEAPALDPVKSPDLTKNPDLTKIAAGTFNHEIFSEAPADAAKRFILARAGIKLEADVHRGLAKVSLTWLPAKVGTELAEPDVPRLPKVFPPVGYAGPLATVADWLDAIDASVADLSTQ